MNVSLYIAKRYLFAKSSNNAINIMTVIASGGVIIAAAALFIVLSVFSGLKDYSLQFSSFTDPDLKLLPSEGKSFLFSDEDAISMSNIEEIVVYSKVVEDRVFIESENKKLVATLKGVDTNYLRVTQMDSMITSGAWILPESNQVVSGEGIAYKLSFWINDFLQPLTLYRPKPGKGQITSTTSGYNSARVTNVGLFNINEELNNEYILSDINLAKDLFNYSDNQISALELKLKPGANEKEVRLKIETFLKINFLLKTELNSTTNYIKC